ncbi:Type 4 fimbrial biogenesis protein PilX N-terminal domain-containing protein [uncultured Thiomicrorhabdus sp.]
MKYSRVSKIHKQGGFMVLLIMLMLVVGSAVWFKTIHGLRSEAMQIEMQNERINELHHIKEKMLTFAIMQPEIFYTETAGVPDFDNIPGPGYFPCPDTDGDGLPNNGSTYPCGSNVGFVTGMVPIKAEGERFTFIDKPRNAEFYWFSVDSRYVTNNQIASHRYLPLNADSPASANLTLDGRTDIVMVLFYSGDPLSSQNRSLLSQSNYLDQGNANDDPNFFTKDGSPNVFNDYVISITREEWRAAVLSRVSKDVNPEDETPDLCVEINSNDIHWFNRCSFIGASPSFVGNDDNSETSDVRLCDVNASDDNFNGQNWRQFFNCP